MMNLPFASVTPVVFDHLHLFSNSSAVGAQTASYISRTKERAWSVLATRRPWRELADVRAIRIRSNAAYFDVNYVIVVHPVVFLSPLWHPTSLMVFLYFVRDEPLVALGRTVNDRTDLIALSMMTLVLLLRTRATSDVLISLLVGLWMVLIHAALRRTEDLVLKEEAAGSERVTLPSLSIFISLAVCVQ